MRKIRAVLFFALVLSAVIPNAIWAFPQFLLYQGRYLNNGTPSSGNVDMEFRITDGSAVNCNTAANGTSVFWTSGSTAVFTTGGLFSYKLGYQQDGLSQDPAFLNINWAQPNTTFHIDVCVANVSLSPKEPVGSNAFAIFAGSAAFASSVSLSALDSSSVTLQGNSFNAPSKLVQLDSSGKLPAVDGSLLFNLSTGAAAGFVQLSSTQTFTGLNTFTNLVTVSSDVVATGQLVAGSDAVRVTTAFGLLDATRLTGQLPALDGSLLFNLSTATPQGTVFLSSTQTFTGLNTFSNQVTVSSQLVVGPPGFDFLFEKSPLSNELVVRSSSRTQFDNTSFVFAPFGVTDLVNGRKGTGINLNTVDSILTGQFLGLNLRVDSDGSVHNLILDTKDTATGLTPSFLWETLKLNPSTYEALARMAGTSINFAKDTKIGGSVFDIPAAKLHVEGDVIASTLTVSSVTVTKAMDLFSTHRALNLSLGGGDEELGITNQGANTFGPILSLFKAGSSASTPGTGFLVLYSCDMEQDPACFNSSGLVQMNMSSPATPPAAAKFHNFTIAATATPGRVSRIRFFPNFTPVLDLSTQTVNAFAPLRIVSSNPSDTSAFMELLPSGDPGWQLRADNGGFKVFDLDAPASAITAEPATAALGVYVSASGNVGIGTSAPQRKLDVDGGLIVRSSMTLAGISAPAIAVSGQGAIYFDSTANKFKVSENGGAFADLAGAGGGGVQAGDSVTWGGIHTWQSSATFQNANFSIGDSTLVVSNGSLGLGIDPSIIPGSLGKLNAQRGNRSARLLTDDGTSVFVFADKTNSFFINRVSTPSFTPSAAIQAVYRGLLTGGTIDSPSATLAEQTLQFDLAGHSGSAFTGSRARMQFVANQDWTASNQGARISLWTTPNNSTAVAERVRITDAGNVGISTMSPTHLLDVNGGVIFRSSMTLAGISAPAVSASGQGAIYFDSTAGKFKVSENGTSFADLVGGSSGVQATDAVTWTQPHTWQSSATFQNAGFSIGASALVVTGGNIGIGTTSPLSTLDSRGQLRVVNSGVTALFQNAIPVVQSVEMNLSTVNNYLRLTGGINWILGKEGDNHFRLSSEVPNQTVLLVSSVTQNVGVKTENPSEALHVAGSVKSDFGLIASTLAVATDKLVVTSAGNVGVGTTNPQFALDVTIAGGPALRGIRSTTGLTNSTRTAAALLLTTGGTMADGFGPTLEFQVRDVAGTDYPIAHIGAVRSALANDGTTPRGSLAFILTNLDGVSTERVRIRHNGDVGIGTTGPQGRLAVHPLSSTAFTLFISSQNGAGTMVVTASGNLGLGTTSPFAPISIVRDQANSGVSATSFIGSNAALTPFFAGFSARNTATAPQATQANDLIVFFGGRGHDGTSFGSPPSQVGISMLAAENWTTTAKGTKIFLRTTAVGSTIPVSAVMIADSGNVGIGNFSPSFKLDVSGIINADDIYKGGVPFTGSSQWTDVTGGINFSGGNVGISSSTPQGLFVVGNGTMVVTSAGNIGIGTATPNVPLHLFTDKPSAIAQLQTTNPGDTASGGNDEAVASVVMLNDLNNKLIVEIFGSGTRSMLFGINDPQGSSLITEAENTGPMFIGHGKQAANAPIHFGTNNTVRMTLTKDGNLGISSMTPTHLVDVNGGIILRSSMTFAGISAPPVSASGQGAIYFDSTANKFKVSENGGAYADLGGGAGGLGGSGTTNRVAKFTAGTTLGDSQITDTGTNVGIASTTPQALFVVGNGTMVVTSAGNVGIGTTSPAFPLELSTNQNLTVAALSSYGSGSSIISAVLGRRSGGSLASPSYPALDDILLSLSGQGYDNDNGFDLGSNQPAAVIELKADENWGAGRHGTKIKFLVMATGSTSQVTPLTLNGSSATFSGNVGIGTESPGSILSFKMGSGTGQAQAAGVANVQTGSVGTDANSTEKTLFTYTLPGNSLNANGKAVRIKAWGVVPVTFTSNQVQVRLYFGSTAVYVAAMATNSTWTIESTVIRTSATNQDAISQEFFSTTANEPSFNNPAETLSNDIVIKVTGQNGAGPSADDVIAKGMLVEYLN